VQGYQQQQQLVTMFSNFFVAAGLFLSTAEPQSHTKTCCCQHLSACNVLFFYVVTDRAFKPEYDKVARFLASQPAGPNRVVALRLDCAVDVSY
jgi:hypothetical protein